MTTIDPAATLPEPGAPTSPRVPTLALVAAAALAAVLLAWANNHYVMTPEVYRAMLGDRLDPEQVDGLMQATDGMRAWGYAMAAVGIVVRVAVVALAVQLVGLVLAVELRFAAAFRAATLAVFGLLYGDLMRIVWLARLDGGIDATALSVTPGSVAHLLMDAPAIPTLWYGLASQLNPWELIWATVLFLGLRETGRVEAGRAVALVSIVWGGLAAFTAGLSVFMARMGG